MKRTNFVLSVCGLVLVLASTSPIYADIARPSKPEKPRVVMHTSMVVTTDAKAYDARLQISQESLNELRAALGDIPGNGSAAQTGGSISQRLTGSSTRTVMAGLMMFLSLSLGGIWLARSVQTRSQKTVAAFLLCTAVIGAAAIITQANAGPTTFVAMAQTVKQPNSRPPDLREREYRDRAGRQRDQTNRSGDAQR